ncbi:hypothetical protein K504DRAFT_298553 [Pleomassaria siparia CBS 279.74]|uniref:Uncharacterized protein n=1 Tax=Pleomassaria siparia CBS 279.74 TaxID=1314801 RepID=A0A6G1K6B8_9PLEO|nr:hypothetical protein K504DRAFT_298553 [Pleomassaria siparia CBS 279.74]
MIEMRKIIDLSLNSINESIVKRTATESLARAALQNPQDSSTPTSVYGNGNFHGQYSNTANPVTDPAITGTPSYGGVTVGASFPYNNGTSTPGTAHAASQIYDQHAYGSGEDAGMTPSHAAALAAAASGAMPQRPNDDYAYANAADAPKNGQQPSYSANGVGSPLDWRQWTRTHMQQAGTQQVGPTGEFLNTANTLMALGGREGGAQGSGQDAGAVDGSAMQAPGPSNFSWPVIMFGMGGTNGHVNQQ